MPTSSSTPASEEPSPIQRARAELERAVRAGERDCAERCLAMFPSVNSDLDAALDIIYSEYLLREQLGHGPVLDQWYARFPHWETELRELFEVHEELMTESAVRPKPGSSAAARSAGYSIVINLDDGNQTLVGGTYRLLDEIGRGGMGVVYRAVDARLNRPVAIKFLHAERTGDSDTLDRFRREAVTASSLNSPNICTIHEFDLHNGQPFIAMELVEGQTLRDWARTAPALRELVQLVAQVGRALAVAHAAGVVHRDIKPGNLMVRSDALVKVLDFGMARLLPRPTDATFTRDASRTTPGTLVGTAAYMSPEQARCETAGPASDIFSLGIVLYELATGRHPFESSSQIGLLGAIVDRSPLPPSHVATGIPPVIDELILRMLAKDPSMRPAAAEVDVALRRYAEETADGNGSRVSITRSRTTIGRDAELAILAEALGNAAEGRGIVLCVSGEPGIGKTTLAEDFLASAGVRKQTSGIARGRCSERLAGSEAYLPVLEALESLLRQDSGSVLSATMKTLAPSWHAQVAATSDSNSRTQDIAPASAQERLKRELIAFLDAVCRERPLVLFLDDLHWGDLSTVDLLSYVGQKCGTMRLLIVLTYRPTDLVLSRHPLLPLKQELEARGLCREVPLSFLGRSDIGTYMDAAFPSHRFPSDFADFIHTKTSGSPLFLVDLLRYLRDVGVIVLKDGNWSLAKSVPDFQKELPQSVRSMVQRKIDQLQDPDRRLLTAASVQGNAFDACVVATALNLDPAEVEEHLDVLDRVHGVVRRVRELEYPDHTLTVRYAFVHVLYQNALYAALQPARKASSSAAVANAILMLHRGNGAAIAAELALLFETARDFQRASEHCRLAAGNATKLFAYREACGWARRGLEQLAKLPEAADRDRLELRLLVALGINNVALSEFTTPEVSDALRRARALCRTLNDDSELPAILWGLFFYYAASGDYIASHAAAGELLQIAEARNDMTCRLAALPALVLTHVHRGEHALCRQHADEAKRLFESGSYVGGWSHIGQDPRTIGSSFGALATWCMGYPDRARRECAESVAWATEPASRAFAYFLSAWVASACGEVQTVREHARLLRQLAEEHKFVFWDATSRCFLGWAMAEEGRHAEAIGLLRDGLEDYERANGVVLVPLFTLPMCAVLSKVGRTDEALRQLERAQVRADADANRYYAPEFWRLKGELLQALETSHQQIESCFRQAIEIARRQGARSLELRAATSLARLYLAHDDHVAATHTLRPVLLGFTEGDDTQDLIAARDLLRSFDN